MKTEGVVVGVSRGVGGWGGVIEREPERKEIKRKGNREAGIVQELCESRGGRPGLSVLTSLLISVT